MKKSILLVLILVALTIISTGVYFAFFASTPNSANTFIVPTNQGSQIKIQDFSKDVTQKTQTSEVFADTPQYTILYFTADKNFLITLNSQPLKDARNSAEQALLQKLNISQTSACQLKISVKVPYDVDADLSGKDLGLSFCQNSIKF